MLPANDYLRFGVSLFTILTPFAALPIYIGLTEGQPRLVKERTARAAAATVLVVLVVAALTGEWVLRALGASLHSFRVGGGVVLLLMALSMLSARVSTVQQSPEEVVAAEGRDSVGVVPLGLPLLAGPGAVSAVIVEMQRSADWSHAAAVLACVASVCLLVYLTLELADPIGRRLGVIGLNIVNRLFGLLLAAIAVEGMAKGLKGLFPALGQG